MTDCVVNLLCVEFSAIYTYAISSMQEVANNYLLHATDSPIYGYLIKYE